MDSSGLDEFMSLVTLMSSQWKELKADLQAGKVLYTDSTGIKNYTFFKVFDDVFNQTRPFFDVPLSAVKHMYRAVNEEKCDYQRMIPKIEYAKEHNRMNPAGQVFLYAGIDSLGYKENKSLIIKTCLKEIRAPLDSIATVCKFKITAAGRKKKVINICGDDTIPKTQNELHKYIFDQYKSIWFTRGREMSMRELARTMAKVYFNLFSSDQIFKPIDNNIDLKEKEREYASFHALAHYIREAGYGGIIYKSTVCKGGRNIVLFDTMDASFVPNTLQQVKVSDYQ
ncbi:RES family NAD+ phosphorylase [Paenibacillus validus]|uniref:RES domain-containing protein n=1 Tax=Paenibacillus validus TaxID=44253 RepID=A0A7X2ZAD4_9BACL|nr:RES family NAD+ phosphorylase [Paenibacillus validus]MUG70583.1 RES domain-containing protein [Paenibacillus validus]